jgi:hypothetical protein
MRSRRIDQDSAGIVVAVEWLISRNMGVWICCCDGDALEHGCCDKVECWYSHYGNVVLV